MQKITVAMLVWNERLGHSEWVYNKQFVNAGAALNAVNRLHKKYPDEERLHMYCEYPREVEWQDRKTNEKFRLTSNEDNTFPDHFPNWMIYEATA